MLTTVSYRSLIKATAALAIATTFASCGSKSNSNRAPAKKNPLNQKQKDEAFNIVKSQSLVYNSQIELLNSQTQNAQAKAASQKILQQLNTDHLNDFNGMNENVASISTVSASSTMKDSKDAKELNQEILRNCSVNLSGKTPNLENAKPPLDMNFNYALKISEKSSKTKCPLTSGINIGANVNMKESSNAISVAMSFSGKMDYTVNKNDLDTKSGSANYSVNMNMNMPKSENAGLQFSSEISADGDYNSATAGLVNFKKTDSMSMNTDSSGSSKIVYRSLLFSTGNDLDLKVEINLVGTSSSGYANDITADLTCAVNDEILEKEDCVPWLNVLMDTATFSDSDSKENSN